MAWQNASVKQKRQVLQPGLNCGPSGLRFPSSCLRHGDRQVFFLKLSKSYLSPWLLVAALCFQQPKSDVGFAPWRWQPGRHVRSGAEQALGSPASGRAAQSPAILSPCTRCLRQTCLVFIACSRPGLLTGCRTESVNGFSLRGREMNRAVFFCLLVLSGKRKNVTWGNGGKNRSGVTAKHDIPSWGDTRSLCLNLP